VYGIAKSAKLRPMVNWPECEHLLLPDTAVEKYETFADLPNARSFDMADPGVLDPAYNWYPMKPLAAGSLPESPRPIQRIALRDRWLMGHIAECLDMWPTVGLHVRRGDFWKTDGFKLDGIGRLPDSWYLRLAGQVMAKVPGVRFYLASNGTEEELAAFRQLPLVPPIDVGMSSRQPATEPVNLAGLVDLFALGMCKGIICSQSTWSMFAACWRGIPAIWPTRELQDVPEGWV